ncbi:MAG: hypothetical protein NC337_14660 [Roseburia sp.]|nr:hypothetical protein [Roseburia sp.]
MDEHKIFKTAVIPVVLMITGIVRISQNLLLSMGIGTGLLLIALLIDECIKNR